MSTPAQRSVLVIDDNKNAVSYLSNFLASKAFDVECAESGEQAVARLSAGYVPSLILLDVILPGIDGIEVLDKVQKINPSIPFMFLSSIGNTKTVVEAMKMGATDFLLKPFEEEELELAIRAVFEKQRLKEEVKTLKRQLACVGAGGVLTANPRMLKIIEIARHVAGTDVPVLLLGETGVGKEVVAKFIHKYSGRSGEFVKVNCAALPHELLESELFGYERGAFTGAIHNKPGKFELADNGTLLLDEIGEMTPHLQAKLLNVLQDGEIAKLGGKKPVKVNVRVIAVTNKKLSEAVLKGEFRNDLYFRLNVIKLEIPPLRDRREDIPLLTNFLLEQYRERYKSDVSEPSKELMEAFLRCDWPGNVRQLENVLKRYAILPDSDIITELRSNQTATAAVSASQGPVSLKEVASNAAEAAGKEVVLKMLEETGWNRKEAARRLRTPYKALRAKLKKWQLVRNPARPPAAAAIAAGAAQ